jgi:hypothetical protein
MTCKTRLILKLSIVPVVMAIVEYSATLNPLTSGYL